MLDQLFTPIEYTIDWKMLFSLVSLTALILRGLDKFAETSKKALRIKQVLIEKLLNKPNQLANELTFLLNGKQIQNLNRIEIGIQNRGRETLSDNDFHVLPKLSLEGVANIISISISTSNDFTNCNVKNSNPNELVFSLSDFEPKDYVRLELLCEGNADDYKPSFQYRLKEANLESQGLQGWHIEKNYGISKDYNAFVYIVAFLGPMMYWLTYFIVKYGFTIDPSNPDKFSIGWKILFFVPTVLVCALLLVKYSNAIKDFHYGYRNVKEWHPISSTDVKTNN